MTKIVSQLNALVWGAPALVLILGVGLYLSLRLRFVQLTLLPGAFVEFFKRLLPGKGNHSSFQALCTALAATVGTGNLVGVAGAICLGGPGAVFWMWICGILGMVTKFAEAALAVRYRVKTADGFEGGPMNVITLGLGEKYRPLAKIYCLFGLIAAFGVGNATQTNAVISGINTVVADFGGTQTLPGNFLMGLGLAVLVGTLLLGGGKRIGAAAERLVPVAAGGYVFLCVLILVLRADAVPEAVSAIIQGAFSPRGVTGGIIGSSFQALRVGCSRGVFTNEAGMGTASIAHACADVSHPVQQGMMGIMEVFLDTIVICTLTALVILVSGIPIPYGADLGGSLTTEAFSSVIGKSAAFFLAAAYGCFAIATVLGWSYYGGRCAQFLFGRQVWKGFALAQSMMVILSSVLNTAVIWQFSEVINGLMVIPNLITLAALTPELVRLTKEYKKTGGIPVGGGNYANFHQCKPL